jgi:hypothetical protein
VSAAIITCPWCGDEIRFVTRHTAAQDLGHHLAEECVSPADDGAPEAEWHEAMDAARYRKPGKRRTARKDQP